MTTEQSPIKISRAKAERFCEELAHTVKEEEWVWLASELMYSIGDVTLPEWMEPTYHFFNDVGMLGE